MHEFDMSIINDLQLEIDKKNSIEKRKVKGTNNPKYAYISQRIARLTKYANNILTKAPTFRDLSNEDQLKVSSFHKEIHKYYLERTRTPWVRVSKKNIKIIYLRYADDWIILTNASRKYCNTIKDYIPNKLINTLKLELSEEKTKITNLKQKNAVFSWLLNKDIQKH